MPRRSVPRPVLAGPVNPPVHGAGSGGASVGSAAPGLQPPRPDGHRAAPRPQGQADAVRMAMVPCGQRGAGTGLPQRHRGAAVRRLQSCLFRLSRSLAYGQPAVSAARAGAGGCSGPTPPACRGRRRLRDPHRRVPHSARPSTHLGFASPRGLVSLGTSRLEQPVQPRWHHVWDRLAAVVGAPSPAPTPPAQAEFELEERFPVQTLLSPAHLW